MRLSSRFSELGIELIGLTRLDYTRSIKQYVIEFNLLTDNYFKKTNEHM